MITQSSALDLINKMDYFQLRACNDFGGVYKWYESSQLCIKSIKQTFMSAMWKRSRKNAYKSLLLLEQTWDELITEEVKRWIERAWNIFNYASRNGLLRGCDQSGRITINYFNWRRKCLTRDKYQCQECGGRMKLHVHHIKTWKDYPLLRLVVDNGKTLCQQCHIETHKCLKNSQN